MTELAEMYHEEHPEVKITYNPDSSGTLLTQIREGYECDIFFSAAQKQMDDLEADGLVEEGTRADVVNNQVGVVARKDSGTSVTGLENIGDAESIALAGGSVPAGWGCSRRQTTRHPSRRSRSLRRWEALRSASRIM